MLIYAVDDEELSLELLEDAIIQVVPDSKPVCFTNPKVLLEAARERIPDIVFLDISMPEMSGLEVARQLNELSHGIRIIFVTGYSEYVGQAFDLYASGYIMKPCRAKAIQPLLEKFQTPVRKQSDILIKTFGNFDIYYKGKPVVFKSGKGKELLAYLVDREGAFVSRAEVAGILFEDNFSHSVQVSLSRIAQALFDELADAGITEFFFIDNGYYLDLQKAECDYIELMRGNPDYTFMGEYMEQYSWGEYRKYAFEKIK